MRPVFDKSRNSRAVGSSSTAWTLPPCQGATRNTYQPLAWQALTELRDAVGKYGLGSAEVMQIHAMVSTPTPPLTIPKGTRNAQPVPFKSSVSRTEDRSRGDGGFGSTGPPQVRWTAVLTKDRPETLCTVSMVGATPLEIHLRGLLDMGADVSILSLAAWPPQWPLSLAKTSISGLGGTKQCYVSQNPVAIMTQRDTRP
ncbi:hypothetical protein DUI87_08026 [Hirundo rustica rustica]|uniref:Peptidase A2 domain-containing protein n=1 Tax=Hirundo rustica rustica TaxID=333673 RepID=A0A3M0KRA5_HIRRU|nr:hypothetical protein DUI87_08026 [Hirundo rustica rustica]